jgi:hypothetical protein
LLESQEQQKASQTFGVTAATSEPATAQQEAARKPSMLRV